MSVEPQGRGGSRSARLSRDCPYCGAREALIIVGARAASLLSVALGQAQGSRYNDDRKVIAFSDNVQDAAHRAGFFAARTAGTAVRAAIAQVVGRHDGIALADLPERVETWWRDRTVNPGAFDDERFVSEFIAPDRLWRRDFVTLQREGRLPAGSRLPEAVAERLRWDTLAELGYRSAIGRTLERTRAAAVGADRDALERACGGALLRIREKFGGLRDLAAAAVRALLLGVLRRMKDRGAIRSDVAAAWLAAGGGRWWLSRRPALQDFGPRSARPVFPVDAPHAADGIEPLFSRNGGRKSWYQAWVERVLTPVDVLAATREAPDVLLEALGALEAAGLVCRIEAGRAGRAWALDPRALLRRRAHRGDALRGVEPEPRRARARGRPVAGRALPGPRRAGRLRPPRGGAAHLVRPPLPRDPGSASRGGRAHRPAHPRRARPPAAALLPPRPAAVGAEPAVGDAHPGTRHRRRRPLHRGPLLGAAGPGELPAAHRARGATRRQRVHRDGGRGPASRPLLLRRAAGHARRPHRAAGRLPQRAGRARTPAHRVLPRRVGGDRPARRRGAADRPPRARQRRAGAPDRLSLPVPRLRAAARRRPAAGLLRRPGRRADRAVARLPRRVPPGRQRLRRTATRRASRCASAW